MDTLIFSLFRVAPDGTEIYMECSPHLFDLSMRGREVIFQWPDCLCVRVYVVDGDDKSYICTIDRDSII